FHYLLLLIGGLVVGAGLLVASILAGLPSPERLAESQIAPSTLILDRHGRLLYEVIDPQGGKHTPVPLSAIPQACRQAVIATEDSRFYQHPGFDLRAIARAAWQDLRERRIVSGGSTITQQVVRNLLLSPSERQRRTLTRKLREAWLAWRLTRRYSKDEILAIYLNQSYFGHFAHGIEAAAQAYYGKSVAELDLAECALLAGLLQSPTMYNPLEHPKAAAARQRVVLELMVKDGYITPEEADLAAAEPLRFASSPFPIEAPHFVMYVQELLEEMFGIERLRAGGLRVYTSLDLDLQHTAESVVRRKLREIQEDENAPPELRVDTAALVALDPRTGEILAMVGSPDYFDARINGAVNGALALRQPGSAIKPITYAVAFDPEQAARAGREVYTPATMVADVRTVFPTREGDPYIPLNYDLDFHGPVLLREALASSLNIPAVKVLQHIGVDALIAQATRMGITTLNDSDRYGLALTLGGGEVRLLELTAAYAAFANGGRRVDPVAILRVEDANGNVLYEPSPRPGDEVLPPQVAYLITDILSDDEARMLGFGASSVLHLSRPAAVKTGTTTDWRDNWTVGYTPDLVTGVWVGNPDNEPMIGVSGVTGAAPIWHDFMELALRGRPAQPFPRPDGLVEVEICADSGLLPTDLCPRRRREIFIAGTEPTRPDDMHQQIAIDMRTGRRAGPDTPPEYIAYRTFWVLPAELQEWAEQHGIPQPPEIGEAEEMQADAPEIAARPEQDGAQQAMEPPLVIVDPAPGSVYRLDPALPAEMQRIQIVARPGEGRRLTEIVLLVDDQPVGRGPGPLVRAWWPLTPGRHIIRAIGTDPTGGSLRSPPVEITVEKPG
ncbi:MAG: penicillin-binding protein 1C, partial [Chloroflexi bacterium]|nr:penicillin-binding protein 1C [Chloroflexota bacterium]